MTGMHNKHSALCQHSVHNGYWNARKVEGGEHCSSDDNGRLM